MQTQVQKPKQDIGLAESGNMRIYEVTKKHLPEEKQKGVDGKACWKGYKRMGTKKKGGKTVDNCVPIKKK